MVKNKPKQRGSKRPPRTGKTKDKVSTVIKKKTLADYCYNTGSAKNMSEYVSPTKFLYNHISITMEDGDDVVEALRTGRGFDHKSLEPKLEASEIEVDPDKPETETKKAHEEKRFELEF